MHLETMIKVNALVDDLANEIADSLVNRVLASFDEFMLAAKCAEDIKQKDIVEIAKTIYFAGWADGHLSAIEERNAKEC